MEWAVHCAARTQNGSMVSWELCVWKIQKHAPLAPTPNPLGRVGLIGSSLRALAGHFLAPQAPTIKLVVVQKLERQGGAWGKIQ